MLQSLSGAHVTLGHFSNCAEQDPANPITPLSCHLLVIPGEPQYFLDCSMLGRDLSLIIQK